MEKILLETLTAKTRALMEAPTCSAEAKAAAQFRLSGGKMF